MPAEDRINILMVDDSPTNLLALEAILRAPDRNLISASSGEEGLRYLLDNEAAVILMDVYMPEMDGLETAEMIRGRDRSRDIPIIFLTADSTGGRHLSRGYSLGAVDYIVKPIEPDILRSKVNVFVELFKKTQQVKQQADLLYEKNLQLENANLARLNMLISLGQELAAEREPGKVLEKFCQSARTIVDAREAAIGVINDGDNHKLEHFFHCGDNKDYALGKRTPVVPQRALDTVIKERRPLRLNEFDDLLKTEAVTTPRSFIGAPIVTSSNVSGWLYLLDKVDAEEFSEADERLAETLATQVAISYENAKLYTDVQTHAASLQLEMAERKQAEEERARLLILEKEAREEAEEANRTKDEFLATLSHELRTPLSAILGWTHLVRTGKLDEKQIERAFETIERNARSQSQLIDDLLDVSRIITGKLQIDLRPVELASIVEAAIDAVRPAAEAKSIHFETKLERTGLVLGEANRLQQVFWNIFNNAVKFTPQDGHVRVEMKRKGSRMGISVTDTGIGISEEFLPYIFDRFRQADGSTTRVHGGLGLGLAIVKHLVQLHHGTVEVTSKGRNLGSKFTITLPITAASALKGDNGKATVSENVRLDMSGMLDGLRILVVDDEADARELVSTILGECGSDVKCSISGEEAMQVFRDWEPDVLVSDIGMPNEDGYHFLKRLRRTRSKWAKEIPAIALTAYATDEDRARALEAGFQMHVAKPIEPNVLVMSIATAVGRRRET